jgi:hypothetical protein
MASFLGSAIGGLLLGGCLLARLAFFGLGKSPIWILAFMASRTCLGR